MWESVIASLERVLEGSGGCKRVLEDFLQRDVLKAKKTLPKYVPQRQSNFKALVDDLKCERKVEVVEQKE